MHAAVAPPVLARIRAAFERNAAGGLLHLGASELAIALPPSLAFGRELAHLFMTRLCAVPDLARQWEGLALPAPHAELAQLLAGLPPMVGAEYLDMARLETLWADLLRETRAQIAQDDGDVQAWLAHKHPSWNLLGRVCFHLAENQANPAAPFAFLATYGATVSQQAKVQHVPLGRALQEYAGSENRDALLGLLMQVHKASEQCPWLAALVASGAIFHARAWSPQDAHQFLQNIPLFEASGIVVRIPDWWKPGKPSRPQVQVNIGQRAAGLGLDALLDFDIAFSLAELIQGAVHGALVQAATDSGQNLGDADLSALFGIDLDVAAVTIAPDAVAAPVTAISASALTARGVPVHMRPCWLKSGVLLATGQRAVYGLADHSEKAIADYLARRAR